MSDVVYKSQAARDAQAQGYGGPSYWAGLDEHAQELHDKFLSRGDTVRAAEMLTRSLGDALKGNNGD
jgi:hypothetical protein